MSELITGEPVKAFPIVVTLTVTRGQGTVELQKPEGLLWQVAAQVLTEALKGCIVRVAEEGAKQVQEAQRVQLFGMMPDGGVH